MKLATDKVTRDLAQVALIEPAATQQQKPQQKPPPKSRSTAATEKAGADKDKEKESPEKIAFKAMCSHHGGHSIVGWSGYA